MIIGVSWEVWGVLLTALFTAVLAYYTSKTYRLQKEESAFRKIELSTQLRTYSAIFLNPAKFVGAYALKTKTYLAISKDNEIRRAIDDGADIMILGRGGIGKSHAAVSHIKRFALRRWYQRWRVCVPDRLNLSNFRHAPLEPRRNYIVFLDDLNEYIEASNGITIFDVIDRIRDSATRIRVVATIRSFESAVEADPNFALAHSYLGTAFEKTHQFQKAIEAHSEAVRLQPGSKHFRYSYAQALARAGQTAAAIGAYEICLVIDPNFLQAEKALRRVQPV